jgi:hypothetical protein
MDQCGEGTEFDSCVFDPLASPPCVAPMAVYQATLVASAVSLSSTTATAHSLTLCKLRETAYGKTLVELMAVQVRCCHALA